MVHKDEINPHNWACLFSELTEVEHDWKYCTDGQGDEIYYQSYSWLECRTCGLITSSENYGDCGDYYDYDDYGV